MRRVRAYRGGAGHLRPADRPEPKLTKAQEIEVKKVARELLEKLQADCWCSIGGRTLRPERRSTPRSGSS